MSTTRKRARREPRASSDRRDEGSPDVAISASVRADALRADTPAQTRIRFVGSGSVVTRRLGVPPTGAVRGVTHRDVSIATDIEALGDECRTTPSVMGPDHRSARRAGAAQSRGEADGEGGSSRSRDEERSFDTGHASSPVPPGRNAPEPVPERAERRRGAGRRKAR